MTAPTRLVLFGAGLIGARHARLVAETEDVVLSGIVDPSPDAEALSADLRVPHVRSLAEAREILEASDGAIIATPNATHREIALACMERGLACLIEKPLAADGEDARAILAASERTGCAVLVGHHRRHHAVTKQARAVIQAGELGPVVAGQVTWCLRKPDDYFAAAPWRQQKGGGPVWINLIHEIDLLRALVGEISEVAAMTANTVRGAGVEDVAAILLRTVSGALITVTVSDATPSPFHFEGASSENPTIAPTGEDGSRFFGTKGTLAFPSLTIWRHDAPEQGWGEPIRARRPDALPPMDGEVALSAQLENLIGIIRGTEEPLVTAHDGLRAIEITEAILTSADTGRRVTV